MLVGIFVFCSSVSKPAYERLSESCSVFNTALRLAINEQTPANILGTKIMDCKSWISHTYPMIIILTDMQKNALSKDGKEYQRPSALMKLIPPELTLHENIMFTTQMSAEVQNIEQQHQRMHCKETI